MGKKVCEDWANLLMNEKVVITLSDNNTQKFIEEVFKSNNFLVKINEYQEFKAAFGTTAYIPYAEGVKINASTGEVETANNINLDFVTAENIFPISWHNGIVIECAFASNKTISNKNYVYLQIHSIVNGFYEIENVLFLDQNGQLDLVENLSSVKGFENMVSLVRTNNRKRQFVIDRLAIANNIDKHSPLGIAVFANSIDVIKGMDVIYDSYINEFVLGKKRILVTAEALKMQDNEPLFDDNDVVFYQLPDNTTDDNFIHEINMDLRTTEHQMGLRDNLNLLSSKCGFGENHYRFENGSVATATQIISENSTLFRVLKKHEIILEDVLKELIYILIDIGIKVLKKPLKQDVEITIGFDDSIIEDKEVMFNRDARLVQMGIMRHEEFRSKYMGESEKEALKNLPLMESLLQNDIGTGG